MSDPVPQDPLALYTFDDFGMVADVENVTTPNPVAEANLVGLNRAIAWSAQYRQPVYGLRNVYTIRPSVAATHVDLVQFASIICFDGCTIARKYDSDGAVVRSTDSRGATWTGGLFLGTPNGLLNYPNGTVFDLTGDDILLKDIKIEGFRAGTGMILRGNRIRVINPAISNPSAQDIGGIQFTGGKGFRCKDGFVHTGGSALQFTTIDNGDSISDGSYIGISASSKNGNILLVKTLYGEIRNSVFEGISGIGGDTGNHIYVYNGSSLHATSSITFRDISIECGGSTSETVLVQSQASYGISDIIFDNLIIRRPKAVAFRVASAGTPIQNVSWIGGGVFGFDTVIPGTCLIFKRANNCAVKGIRITGGSGGPLILVGDTVFCENIHLADIVMTGVAAGQIGVTFDKAVNCGWSGGAIQGASMAKAVSFTASAVGCYVEQANLAEIGEEPKVSSLAIDYRLTANFGSRQNTPIGFGPQASVALSSGSAITIASGFVQIVVPAAVPPVLHTINGGQEGDLVVLTSAPDGPTITVTDSAGNLRLQGNFLMTGAEDTLTLLRRAFDWIEIARSDNS